MKRPGSNGSARRLFLVIGILLVAVPSFGWGQKGHFLVNLAATAGIPTELPDFFRDASPQLVYLGYDPDRWRGAGESLDAVNPPDHFLDYEYVAGLELPVDRYAFIELLQESGTLRRLGISVSTSGFLPWRIAEVSELLERQWRIWSTADLTQDERAQVEQNIIHYAGILGHYVGDAANPHHSTIHYNGWVAMNPEGWANDCEIHYRFETAFVTRVIEPADLFSALEEMARRDDYFSAGLDLIRDSNAEVEELYRIDRDGGFTGRGDASGKAFAKDRLARGASVLRDLWWSTYLNATRDE